jgi:hypothetical protein
MTPKTKNNEQVQSAAEKPIAQMNLLEKINNIRKIWSATDEAKQGKGSAGGGSKYDYYKPQQVIDFCLGQELSHGLFSEFLITEGEKPRAIYNLVNLDTAEVRSTGCPFEIPTKMGASQCQQVGAAMTYYQRRLAMLMYKMEDNSKENVSVMGDADYPQSQEIPAPEIKAPPVAPPPVATPTKEAEPVTEKALPPAAPAPQEVSNPIQEAPVAAPAAQPLPARIGSPLSTPTVAPTVAPSVAPPTAPSPMPSAPSVNPISPVANPSKSIEGLYN